MGRTTLVDMANNTRSSYLITCFFVFITAAVLAAVTTKGTTSITGIANQRVKECNRIEAMRTELGKFGVTCRELEDGIEIDSNGTNVEAHEVNKSFW